MKNISFNRKSSVLRNMEEKPKLKKKRNWDRMIYFIVLIGILFFIFKYLFFGLFYVEAPGHVLFNKTNIRVPEDISIQNIYKKEGDTVQIGDTLFSFTSAKEELLINSNLTQLKDIRNNNDWAKREVYKLKQAIEINTHQINEKKNLINSFQKRIKNITNEVILDITPKSKLENYEKEIEKLKAEINKINEENSTLNNSIKNLVANHNISQSNLDNDLNLNESFEAIKKYYRSQTNSVITQIFKSDYEVALKSENIMNLHKRENIYIKAYFEQEDYKHIHYNDKVTIELPNGDKLSGRIRRFYMATYRLPDEFQKKYDVETLSNMLNQSFKYTKISLKLELKSINDQSTADEQINTLTRSLN